MTQKELVRLCWKNKVTINPNTPKKGILEFINNSLNGLNSSIEWDIIANEWKQVTISDERNKKLKSLGI